jgi:hypothetical protein
MIIWSFAMTQSARREYPRFKSSSSVPGSPAEGAQFFGMPIFGPYREPIGSIANIIVDRVTGRIVCIVAIFEFLDLKGGFYPIPWMAFKFNPDIEGYQTHLVEKQLVGAPRYPSVQDCVARYSEDARSIGSYYGCRS